MLNHFSFVLEMYNLSVIYNEIFNYKTKTVHLMKFIDCCLNFVRCSYNDHNTNLNIVFVALESFQTLYVNHNIVVAS